MQVLKFVLICCVAFLPLSPTFAQNSPANGFACHLGVCNGLIGRGEVTGNQSGSSCQLRVSFDNGAGIVDMTGACIPEKLWGKATEKVGGRQDSATYMLSAK